MIVEADDDRQRLADAGADAAQQLALPVLEVLADHGTVQVEVDRVDGHALRQLADKLGRDALEGIARDHAPGAAAGPQQRHDVVLARHRLQEAGQRERDAAEPRQHVAAPHQRRAVPVAAEVVEVCHRRDECVGLVMEAANGDACHARLLPPFVMPGPLPRSPRAAGKRPCGRRRRARAAVAARRTLVPHSSSAL